MSSHAAKMLQAIKLNESVQLNPTFTVLLFQHRQENISNYHYLPLNNCLPYSYLQPYSYLIGKTQSAFPYSS